MKQRELLQSDRLRGMALSELAQTLDQKYLEMMNLRFQFATGRLEDTNRLRQVKQEIARIKTVMRERELWQEYEQGRAS